MLCMNGKIYTNLGNGWKVFVPIPGRLQQVPSGFSYLTAKRLEPSS